MGRSSAAPVHGLAGRMAELVQRGKIKGGKEGIFASRGGGVVLATLDGLQPALPGRPAASLA